jgi:hypothetical protein
MPFTYPTAILKKDTFDVQKENLFFRLEKVKDLALTNVNTSTVLR